MNWWFVGFIALAVLGLGINIGGHGKSKGNYNGWSALIATIIEILVVYQIAKGGL